jgi:hypothetical protein
MNQKLIMLANVVLGATLAGCATKPDNLHTAWTNDSWDKWNASQQITNTLHLIEFGPPRFIYDSANGPVEFGLRSDGVVVWRKTTANK